MERKTNSEDEEKESFISDILKNKIYEINIQGTETEDLEKMTIDIALWADPFSQDIIHKVNRIIQTEVGYVTNLMGNKDFFKSTCNLLFQNFYMDFIKNNDLEKSIESKITDLERYNFLSPKSLYEKHTPIEEEYEEISFDKLIDLLKELRERRIRIYKSLLNSFKKNKREYMDFMKEQDYSYF